MKCSYTTDCHISQGIMIWGISSLGTKSPLIPSAEVTIIKCDHVIIQEIGCTSAARLSKSCLSNHRIAFDI